MDILDDTSLQSRLSRRTFLQGSAVVGAASMTSAIRSFNPYIIVNPELLSAPPVAELKEFVELNKNLSPKIKEVRKKLGFSASHRILPFLSDLKQDFTNNFVPAASLERRSSRRNSFEIDLPYDYRDKVKDKLKVIDIAGKALLGNNQSKVLKKICLQSNPEDYFSFDINDGRMLLPMDPYTLKHTENPNLVDIAVHELGGHGTDPIGFNIRNNYPTNTVLKMLYGKHLALDKARDFPDLFFNHAQDTTRFDLFNSVGNCFIRNSTDACAENFMGDTAMIDQIVQTYLDSTYAIYESNESRNREMALTRIGGYIFDGVRGDLIQFNNPQLELEYNQSVEFYANEQYAEMVRHTILYPSLLIGDAGEQVMEGVQIVYDNLYQSSVDFTDIADNLVSIS